MPKGAKSYEEGVQILDLQIIDLKKQNDLYHAKILKRQQQLEKMSEEYQRLLTYKNESAAAVQKFDRPPETMQEDQNRKVCNNNIHQPWHDLYVSAVDRFSGYERMFSCYLNFYLRNFSLRVI